MGFLGYKFRKRMGRERLQMKAEIDVSKEYHIRLFDIKKLVRA